MLKKKKEKEKGAFSKTPYHRHRPVRRVETQEVEVAGITVGIKIHQITGSKIIA